MSWRAALLILYVLPYLLSMQGEAQGEPIPSSAFSVRLGDKNVEMCKDPQMFFLLECKRPNDNQPENCSLIIGSRTVTCYWVEERRNYTYIILSQSSKMSRPLNNAVNVCSVQMTGPEMRVPIGGYPNFIESGMAAKLCLMNGSVCQTVSSYHNGISSRNNYEDRIDFNTETGQFILLNATESDNGTYRYTVTRTQNLEPVPNEYFVHLRIGVCSDGDAGINAGIKAGNNAGLIAGIVIAVLMLIGSIIGLYYCCKGTKSKSEENKDKHIYRPAKISERSLLVDKRKDKKRSAGKTKEKQSEEKHGLLRNEELPPASFRRKRRSKANQTKTDAAPL